MLKKTISNIASTAFSDLLTRGVFILFSAIVARTVEKQEFALFSLSVSLGIYFLSIVDGGIVGHSTKLAAKANRTSWPEIIGTATTTRLGLSVIFGLILLPILSILPISTYESLVYSFSLLYVVAISILLAWFLRGIQDNLGYFISYSSIAFFLMISLVGFYTVSLYTPQNALSSIIFRNTAFILGALTAFVFTLKRNRIRISSADFRFSLSWVKQTYPLGIAAILYSSIPIFPQIALRILDLVGDLALYGAIWTIQQVLVAAAGILGSTFLPMLARYSDRGIVDPTVVKIHFSIVLSVGLFISLLWHSKGEEIIILLFGEEYNMAKTVLPLFSMALAIVFIRLSLNSILMLFGLYYRMLISGITALILMTIFLFFSKQNLVTASQAYLLGESIILLMNLFFAWNFYWRQKRAKHI